MRLRTALATFGVLFVAACGASPRAQPSATPLSTVELKYRLLAQLGPLDYCDPDSYPLTREVTPAYVTTRVTDIAAHDPQTYQAILAHHHLTPPLNQQQEQQVYADYKELAAVQLSPQGDKYDFAFLVLPASGKSTLTKGTIDKAGSIAVQSRTPSVRICPICLAASTTIATPNGPVLVTSLRPGTLVWSADRSGNRLAVHVVKVGSMLAPAGHQVVHLVLADAAREVWVSPGHPLPDGRHVGDLVPGDVLDGSRVVTADLTPYVGRTYDILPAGPSGAYWANGVLLGSTLTK